MEHVRVYDLVNFGWRQVLIENSSGRVAIQLIADNYKPNRTGTEVESPGVTPLVTNGTLNLTLSGYAEDGYGRWLPHLSHSRKTNQFDIQLQGLQTNSGFNASRFALEFVMVSYVDKNGPWGNSTEDGESTTLDDEHTPGIFVTKELIMPGKNESLKSYIQWRPIVYNTMERELSSSTGLTVMDSVDVPAPAATSLKGSIMFLLYGMDLDDVVVKAFNISFGAKDDGFYQKSQYHAWTFTFGTGMPIRNGMGADILLAGIALAVVTGLTLAVGLSVCVHDNCIKAKSPRLISELLGQRYVTLNELNEENTSEN